MEEEIDMAAAALTPTSVIKTFLPATIQAGTALRLVKYFVTITKITAADWIVAATHCPGTYLLAAGATIDGSGDGAVETVTFVSSTDKIILGGSDVGTAYLEVTCSQ